MKLQITQVNENLVTIQNGGNMLRVKGLTYIEHLDSKVLLKDEYSFKIFCVLQKKLYYVIGTYHGSVLSLFKEGENIMAKEITPNKLVNKFHFIPASKEYRRKLDPEHISQFAKIRDNERESYIKKHALKVTGRIADEVLYSDKYEKLPDGKVLVITDEWLRVKVIQSFEKGYDEYLNHWESGTVINKLYAEQESFERLYGNNFRQQVIHGCALPPTMKGGK